MIKNIDLNKSVFELTEEYPELIDIMADLGFADITKKTMLQTVGKIMTIPKGAKIKGIPMEKILSALKENGFKAAGAKEEAPQYAAKKEKPASSPRTEQLKAYLKRLGEGEDLESVRADFAKEFSEVEASEIMKAEQELLKEGVPLSTVQRLCDVHSALFHGSTKEERIANAEKEVENSLKREKENKAAANYSDKSARAAELQSIKGHPLETLKRENDVLSIIIDKTKAALANNEGVLELINKLRGVSTHYAKKGDLIYPLLKVNYGVSGPSDVMWTVDGEIRDELSILSRKYNESLKKDLEAVIKRAEEMIYKEQNILFPICAVNFTQEEWVKIYEDSKDYEECFDVSGNVWEEAENSKKNIAYEDAEISMPGGTLNTEELTAMLNTIPMEITFVDKNNINRYFNEGHKLFKRPKMALGREVFSCHPPKVEPMVRQIIDDFKSGIRDEVPVWMEKGGRPVLVKYIAVRDKSGKYVGTMEIVQDMEFAKEHFMENIK